MPAGLSVDGFYGNLKQRKIPVKTGVNRQERRLATVMNEMDHWQQAGLGLDLHPLTHPPTPTPRCRSHAERTRLILLHEMRRRRCQLGLRSAHAKIRATYKMGGGLQVIRG